jgi:cobalt-precorrin 5A hydrolase/precorrin-3B C17-methyltransferase
MSTTLAPKITGLVTATEAGRRAAADLADALDPTRSYPVTDLRRAWQECDALVCFLAVGATVRLVAPLLHDKSTDPGVVCVDETGRFAVPVLGGHAGSANALATRVAELLGATPVVTTATDSTGMTALDQLGLPVAGDIAAVTRALLNGEAVTLTDRVGWPLPALRARRTERPAAPCVVITDRQEDIPSPGVVVHPPTLIAGIGASRGAPADDILAAIRSALREAGLAPESLAALATVDIKAVEPGILAAADALGLPLRTFPADGLAAIDVPTPSDVVRAAVGTPSVAEAAALAAADGGPLIVAKQKSAGAPALATVAIARRRSRGRLAIIGLGPGARDLMTARAIAELRRASVVVGLDQYVEQVRDLLRPGTRLEISGLGAEEARARTAVELARAGNAVALIGSGDAGIYAMASPALEMAELHDGFDVVGVPGVTAMLAAAAELGAPLGHDHCAISLSDLHTPWEVIEQRIVAAAEADLVVAFYNPRSRGRDWQLAAALTLLSAHRPESTPVGIVTDASRSGQHVLLTTLDAVPVEQVGMTSLVLVGSSQSTIVDGRFLTPRGYRWRS